MKQSWSTTTSTTACRFCEEEFSNTQTHLSFFCKWTYISGPFYRHCFNTWMHRLSCVLLQTEPYDDMKHQNLELVAPLVTCFTHWTLCQWTLMQHWTVKNVKCKPAISNTAVDEFGFFFVICPLLERTHWSERVTTEELELELELDSQVKKLLL